MLTGYLTIQPGVPEITTDQIAKTAVHYSPVNGSTVDLLDDSMAWQPTTYLASPTDTVGPSFPLTGLTAGSQHDFFFVRVGTSAVLGRAAMPFTSGSYAKVPHGTPTTAGTGAQGWVRADQAINGNLGQAASAGARCTPSNSGLANFIGEIFAASATISRVRLYGPSDDYLRGDAASSLGVRVDVTTDGSTWSTVYSGTISAAISGGVGAVYTLDFAPVSALGYRVGLTGNGMNAINVGEIEAYAFSTSSRGLVRYDGCWTNQNAITLTTAKGDTLPVAPYRARYLGSGLIDDNANGQMSAHVSYGPSRRWPLWNIANQRHICLKAGTSGSQPILTYPVPWGPLNGEIGNSLTVFTGLPSSVALRLHQSVTIGGTSGSSQWGNVGIGRNGSTVPLNPYGQFGADGMQVGAHGCNVVSSIVIPDVAARNDFMALYEAHNMLGASASVKFSSGEDDSVLSAQWMG
jgi:hypothetical protein